MSVTKSENYICVNGEIVAEKSACLSIRDRAFHFGDGIYETIFISKGNAVDVRAHLDRIHMACERFHFNIHFDLSTIETILAILVEKNAVQTSYAYAKVIVTRIADDMGISLAPSNETNFYIVVDALDIKHEMYEEGVSLFLKHLTVPPPHEGYTTLSRLHDVVAFSEGREKGFDDVLFVYNGNVLECTTSNIFVRYEGTIYTPDANIVSYITRETIILIAGLNGYEILVEDIAFDMLWGAEEVFVGNPIIGVVPVNRIGNHFYKIGEAAKTLGIRYNEHRGYGLQIS